MSRKQLPPFDKYEFYQKAVQSPQTDVEFFYKTYKKLRGRAPRSLREDFCGTFLNLCHWVRYKPGLTGMGVDLDGEPLAWGYEHNLIDLKPEQVDRLRIIQGNVLSVHRPQVDLITALNFSYFAFHDRRQLKEYFRECREALKNRGVLMVDCFGGAECQAPITDKTRRRGFLYYWDQASYDPIGNRAKFHIHFKRDGEKIRKRVFTYDWRMWTIPEIREIMTLAGFRKTLVYWEGDDGVFRRAKMGEPCAAWIAYVVGLK